MKALFIDESGDHNLSIVDSTYPVFVLAGIIVDLEYAEGQMTDLVNDFKKREFGNTEIILHTADIIRNRNGFEGLAGSDKRRVFYEKLNRLMRILDYKVVACAIKKDSHLARYGLAALDPYMLSLDILVERFCFEVGEIPGGGLIIAEKRGPELDHQLELAWLNLKIRGTRYISANEIEKRIVGLNARHKKENIAGLQIADLVASPIGRHVIGKPEREDFQIIREKFRKSSRGSYSGWGLVVLPREVGPAPATQ
jgi:hypothetical protein